MQKPYSPYLARNILPHTSGYSLRQSYRDENNFLWHRLLIELGNDPEKFIIYIDDNGFYISDELVDIISPFVGEDAGDLLEKLLWPFVRHDIRNKLEIFENRKKTHISKVSTEEKEAIKTEIHLFDRRRLHYLWYGSIDQSGLYKMPDKLCRKLLNKSRDEREQYFMEKEKVLFAGEVKEYLFTVFNLQHYFEELYALFMPEALSQEKLDSYFIDELCLLDDDLSFWQGMQASATLQPYFIRYLIMFFDYGFTQSQAEQDFIKQYMNNHRKFHFPKKKVDMDQVSEIFHESAETLQSLSKKELTKLYRKKAKELHPDIGGEHEEFVKLTEVYEQLLKRK